MHTLKSSILCLLFIFGILNGVAQTAAGLDLSFNTTGTYVGDGGRKVNAILPLADGSVIVAQNVTANSGHSFLRKHKADGSIDVTFGSSGKFAVQVASTRTEIYAIKLYDNNIFVAGETFDGMSKYCFVAKIKQDGSGYNTNFGIGGIKTTYFLSQLEDMVIDADGNIFLLGTKDYEYATIIKILANGNTDVSFGNSGRAQHQSANSSTYYWMYSLAIDKYNNLVATGKYYNYTTTPFNKLCIMKVKPNGSLDASFDGDGMAYYNSSSALNNEGRKIMIDDNNNYLVGGSAPQAVGNNTDFALLKTNDMGIADNSFGTNGWKQYDLNNNGAGENAVSGVRLADGRILLTGISGIGDTIRFGLLMLNADGTRNTTFASNGVYQNIFGTHNNNAGGVCAVDANGKIYMGGYTRTCTNGVCGPLSAALAKYTGAEVAPSNLGAHHTEESMDIYPNPCTAGSKLQINHTNQSKMSSYAQLISFDGKSIVLPIIDGGITMPQHLQGLFMLKYQYDNRTITKRLLVQ